MVLKPSDLAPPPARAFAQQTTKPTRPWCSLESSHRSAPAWTLVGCPTRRRRRRVRKSRWYCWRCRIWFRFGRQNDRPTGPGKPKLEILACRNGGAAHDKLLTGKRSTGPPSPARHGGAVVGGSHLVGHRERRRAARPCFFPDCAHTVYGRAHGARETARAPLPSLDPFGRAPAGRRLLCAAHADGGGTTWRT